MDIDLEKIKNEKAKKAAENKAKTAEQKKRIEFCKIFYIKQLNRWINSLELDHEALDQLLTDVLKEGTDRDTLYGKQFITLSFKKINNAYNVTFILSSFSIYGISRHVFTYVTYDLDGEELNALKDLTAEESLIGFDKAYDVVNNEINKKFTKMFSDYGLTVFNVDNKGYILESKNGKVKPRYDSNITVDIIFCNPVLNSMAKLKARIKHILAIN